MKAVPLLLLCLLVSILASPWDAARATQCDDMIDNNSDGFVDLADLYCKAPTDNDESSFASGFPETNQVNALDCWFDTNAGSGDDGCSMHACCDIDGDCPADLDPAHFDPNQCSASQTCNDNCAPLAKAGCDCFGCCEVCSAGNGCLNVFVNPAVSPQCTGDVLDDPAKCRTCTPNPTCWNPSHIYVDGFDLPPLI